MRKLLFLFSFLAFITIQIKGQEVLFQTDFEGEEYVSLTENAGNWTLVNNGQLLYTGISGASFTDYENKGINSFLVFDHSRLAEDVSGYSYEVYSGNKAMITTVPQVSNLGSDVWLISPKIEGLSGTGNVVTFFLKSTSDLGNNAEFRVLVATASSGDPDKMGEGNFDESKFTLLSDDRVKFIDYVESGKETRWVKFVYSLDEYAGTDVYIAINNISISTADTQNPNAPRSIGFMVDDFSVISGACTEEIQRLSSNGIIDGNAVINWQGNAAKYDLEYGPKGFDLGKGTRRTITTTSFTIEDLDPENLYHVYVRAYCSDVLASEVWSNPIQLKFNVAPIEITLEESYEYGFESYDIEMDGWRIETLSDNGEWRHMDPDNSFYHQAHQGKGFVKFFSEGNKDPKAEADSWIISRGLQLIEGQEIVISYYMAAPFYEENFKVMIGMEGDAEDLKQGKELINQVGIKNGEYVKYVLHFTPEESGVYYLGFCCYSTNNSSQLWFDYVNVMDARNYVEDEEYEVLIEDNFDTGYADFATGTVGDLRFFNIENKEKIVGSQLSDNLEFASFMVYPEGRDINGYDFTAYSGDKSLVVFAAQTGVSNDWLVTKRLQLGTNGNILSFWVKAPNMENNNEKFCILVSNTDTTTEVFDPNVFEVLETVELKDYLQEGYEENWVKLFYSLDEYAGQQVYVAINYVSSESEGASAIMIDDLKIVQGGSMDSSIMGVQFYNTSISDSSASIYWTSGGAYGYDIEYGEKGYQLGKGTSEFVSLGQYTMNNLEENTVYEVYIRSWKDADVISEAWVGPFEFRTEATPVRVVDFYDFKADFETEEFEDYGWRTASEDPTSWFQVNGDQTNAYAGDGYLIYDNESTKAYYSDFMFTQPFIIKGTKELYISFRYKTTTPEAKFNLYLLTSNINKYEYIAIGGEGDVRMNILESVTNMANADYEVVEIKRTFVDDGGDEQDFVTYLGLNCEPTVTGVHGKLFIDDFTIRMENVVGIDKNENGNIKFSVYPIPAVDNINIRLPEYFDAQTTKVAITDIAGKKIKEVSYTEVISISDLVPGSYIITVTDGLNRENKMFIKK